MASWEKTLTQPPTGERALDLWTQHAAGSIFFEDVRAYAIERLDATLIPDARAAALKAFDDAVFGLVMVLDGVSGALSNERHSVRFSTTVKLTDRKTDETIAEVNLANGDGMCMGYHGWLDGDFVKDPPTKP